MSKEAGAFQKGVRKTEDVLSLIGVGLFLIMMFVGAGDVIGRYVFNRPISGALEISQIAMLGVVLFFLASTQAKKGHITVEIVFNRYPPRVKTILGLATLLLSLAIFGLIAWQAGVIALEDWQEQRIFPVSTIPYAPVRFFISLGAFVLCLEFIIQMLRLLPELKRETED